MRPADWVGAYHVALGVLSGGTVDLSHPIVVRSAVNAEAMIRDDARLLTTHVFTTEDLPADRLVLALGAGTSPLHRLIAERLVEMVPGLPVATVDAADDHEIYLTRPDVLASWLTDRAAHLAATTGTAGAANSEGRPAYALGGPR